MLPFVTPIISAPEWVILPLLVFGCCVVGLTCNPLKNRVELEVEMLFTVKEKDVWSGVILYDASTIASVLKIVMVEAILNSHPEGKEIV